MALLLSSVVTFLVSMSSVWGHGRLMDPPSRNSMWRLGFPNPVNYNDNELYCGGRVTQWARNKGKCGVCGDPHHHPQKDHEVGGKYANGIISREYVQGGVIDVTVHITANHKGYFEFRICPVEDPKVEVNQDCLDKHLMKLANGEESRYYLPEGKSNQFFNVSLALPADLTCTQCVIQWKYRTGNTWDKDENGKFCVGCGPQEEFYNCADVSIHPPNSDVRSLTKPTQTGTESNEKIIKKTAYKMEDIIFTNKKDKFENSVHETMSNYGKKKVSLIRSLNSNYSNWSDKDQLVTKSKQGSPFAYRDRKASVLSSGQKSTSSRFGYVKDRYNGQNPDLRSVGVTDQPGDVAYRWKVGIPEISDVERIQRRFGFSSAWSRFGANLYNNDKMISGNDMTSGSDMMISGNSKLLSGSDKVFSVSDKRISGNDKLISVSDKRISGNDKLISGNDKIISVSDKTTSGNVKIISGNDKMLSGNDKMLSGNKEKKDVSTVNIPLAKENILDEVTLSSDQVKHREHETNGNVVQENTSNDDQKVNIFPSLTVIKDVTKSTTDAPKYDISETNKPQDNLENMISNKNKDQRQDDNFLRRWKLMRLRHIAAVKAARNVKDGRVKNSRQEHIIGNDKLRASLAMQTASYKNASNTRPASHFMTSLNELKDLVYTKDQNSDFTSNVKLSYKESLTTESQSNKQKYVKKRLPSWLVTALKMNYKKNENVGQFNANEDVWSNGESNSTVVAQISDLFKKPFETSDWSNKYHGYRKLSPSTTYTEIDKRPQQLIVTSVQKEVGANGNAKRKDDVSTLDKVNKQETEKLIYSTKMATFDDELGNLSVNNSEDSGRKDTESLVKYIVTLLLSRKRNDKSNRDTIGSESLDREVPEGIPQLKKKIIKSTVEDIKPPGNGWLIYDSIDTSDTKNTYLDNGQRTDNTNRHVQSQMSTSDTTNGDQTQIHETINEYKSPVVRGEVRSYSGLILGPVDGYKRTSQNDIYQAGKLPKHSEKIVVPSQNRNNKKQDNNNANNYILHTQNSDEVNKESLVDRLSQDVQPRAISLQAQDNKFLENVNDPHHQWSLRAASRRDHYKTHQQSTTPKMVCESLVVLGGGMDRWCTDNCNANFCPPSMCVCTSKSIPSPTYARLLSSSPTLAKQHSRAFKNNKLTKRADIYPNFNWATHVFSTTAKNQKDRPILQQHLTLKNVKSYLQRVDASASTVAPVSKDANLQTYTPIVTKGNTNIFSASRVNMIPEPMRIVHPLNWNTKNSGVSNGISYSPWKSRSINKSHFGNVAFSYNLIGQNGIRSNVRNYHRNDKHSQLSPFTKNNIKNYLKASGNTPAISHLMS